jgi:hypothetical protein
MRGPTARPNNEKQPHQNHTILPNPRPPKKRQRRSALQPRVGRTTVDLPWDQRHNTPNRNVVPPISSCPNAPKQHPSPYPHSQAPKVRTRKAQGKVLGNEPIQQCESQRPDLTTKNNPTKTTRSYPKPRPPKKRQRRSALQPRVGRTTVDLPWDQRNNTPNRNAVPPISSCPSETTLFVPNKKRILNHSVTKPQKTLKNQ